MARYSLERKSYVSVIAENFEDTLKSTLGFACCTVGTGIAYGIVHDMEVITPDPSDPRIIPVLFAVGSVYYARQVYKNYKQERARFHQLAVEMEKRRLQKKKEQAEAMKGFITPEQMTQLQFQHLLDRDEKIVKFENYNKILEDNPFTVEDQDSVGGASQGKRKSLNNGIFKPNDN